MDLKEIGKLLQRCSLPSRERPSALLRYCVKMCLVARLKDGRYLNTADGYGVLKAAAMEILEK